MVKRLQPNCDADGPVSFATLMALEQVGNNTYRSLTAAFEPAGGLFDRLEHVPPRAYGGFVYAQAVWAAAQTMIAGEQEWVVHSVTGYFVQLGRCDLPFLYHVENVRNGRGFCVRHVNATQQETNGIVFTCTCSFKLPDESSVDVQKEMNVREKYGNVLGGVKTWWELEDAPSVLDVSRFTRRDIKSRTAHPFPGLHVKMPNMTAHNESRSWQERRSLLVYTTIGAMPTGHNALVLHACAHLYLSDKHSLEFAAAHTSLEKRWTAMASLSHTVIFHTSGLALVFGQTGTEDGQQQEEKWFVQEVWTDRVVDGRIVHKSKIYSEDGVHVASTMQDGLLRLAPDADQDVEGEPKGWGARRKRLSKM